LALYDRYELLELRRDDGIQTFHAREIETARPVQFHLFTQVELAENLALLSRLEYLPDAERRRVIERGEYQGQPYVITDRLAGYPGFREWLMVRTDPSVRNSLLDGQFYELFDAPRMDGAETASLTAVQPAMSDLDRQFYELFDSPNGEYAETTAVAAIASGHEAPRARVGPVAARSLLGIAVGILAAILVLGLLVAVVVFRPW
jgi:hypothetical protein